MTRVLAIIGARLNSSRLPRKHLLDLAGKPLIGRIFQRLEQVAEIDRLVLATTADSYNLPLVEWAQAAGREVFAFEGEVDDLVGRVDAVVQGDPADIVVYICGDSPLIEPATLSRLIRSVERDSAVDLVDLCLGEQGQSAIHEGFNVYPRRTWQRLVELSDRAHYREHVGAALRQPGLALRTLRVADEAIFYQCQHRLSVDTPSDYRFMATLYRRWYARYAADTIVSLAWVIEELQRDSALRAINAEVKQKGVSDRSIRTLIVLQSGSDVGLGHFSRMEVLSRALQDHLAAGVMLLIQGEPFDYPALALLPHRFVAPAVNLAEEVPRLLERNSADVVIFDLAHATAAIGELASRLRRRGVVTVAVDGLQCWPEAFDLIHIPSFYLDDAYKPLHAQGRLHYGWDHYLISADFVPQPRPRGQTVVVLTGGGDVAAVGAIWPALLDQQLPSGSEVVWLQGRYASEPALPASPRLKWRCLRDSSDMPARLGEADYGLALYGVSLFELLQQGVPSVTWAASDAVESEMAALAREGVVQVADSPEQAVTELARLMRDGELADRLAAQASTKLAPGLGAKRLVLAIAERVLRR